MSDKLEQVISKIVMDLMLEADAKGVKLSFRDICTMVGVPVELIEENSEADTLFTLNDKFIDALTDKDLRDAMIERSFSTIH